MQPFWSYFLSTVFLLSPILTLTEYISVLFVCAVVVCTVLAAFSHSKFTLLCEQAYASYMKGSVSFELQNWKEAFELFGHAQ